MLFAFLISILGFAVAYRISKFFIHRNLLSKSEMTKIGTAFLVVAISFIAIVPRARIALWIAIFLPLSMMAFSLVVLVKTRAKRFRERFLETLTLILLKMKSGKSFRQALAESVDESDRSHRTKLGEIANVVAFSQQDEVASISDEFVREVVVEFKRVDQSPHSAIRRLTVFRDKLRIEDDFRHRSGQALAQIRAQSFVMSGLYLAVLLFTLHRFGWRKNSDVFLASFALFACGAIWIWFGGRRMKWKV